MNKVSESVYVEALTFRRRRKTQTHCFPQDTSVAAKGETNKKKMSMNQTKNSSYSTNKQTNKQSETMNNK